MQTEECQRAVKLLLCRVVFPSSHLVHVDIISIRIGWWTVGITISVCHVNNITRVTSVGGDCVG